MSLSRQVLRTIRRHGLIPRGGRVVVALSGGGDSVALLHLLRELQSSGELTIAGVAHFNHQLRGTEADEDEVFCRSAAAAVDLPIDVGRADVRQRAREMHRSVEDACRVLRYAFLEESADRCGACTIAVAHSLDDQAETFLLRLLRGAGPRGLAGILPKAGRVVRPLLDVTRAELRQYLAQQQLAFRDDSSNNDLTIPRNRVRHELLPYLEREFSPGVVAVLAREAEIARLDEERLNGEAIDLAASIVLDGGARAGTVELNTAGLTGLHPAVSTRVARLALSQLAKGRFLDSGHLERFLRFARNGVRGSALSLPGQHARHLGATVVLGPAPPRTRDRTSPSSFRVPLSIPGEVTLSIGTGWEISAERLEAADSPPTYWKARGTSVVIATGRLNLPLAVRSRRAGDRFSPLGLGGRRKKLQDFLVNRRVPRDARDSLPLVVDGGDRIVWVVGESVAEDFRVTDPSQGVILLKARRLGGPG